MGSAALELDVPDPLVARPHGVPIDLLDLRPERQRALRRRRAMLVR